MLSTPHSASPAASRRVALSAACAALLLVGATFHARKNRQESESMSGMTSWPVGWPSPAWAQVDCHNEILNTNISCGVLHRCLLHHGVSLLLNDTKGQLPFWYAQPLGHMTSQAAAAAAATRGESKALLAFLSSHYHESYLPYYSTAVDGQVSPGVMHGALWYTAGAVPAYMADTWGLIELLCPMPDKATSMTRSGLSTDASMMEFVMECVHGVGHAGFVQVLGKANAASGGYGACDDVSFVSAEGAIAAWSVCASAPSIALESLCAEGYFHGVFEHFDHEGTDHSWVWPCDSDILPYPEKCWFWLNVVMGQTDYFNEPQLSKLGDVTEMWLKRRAIMDDKLANDPTFCHALQPESSVLACIDGMAALTACTGPWCWYFRPRLIGPSGKDQMEYNLIDLCTTLVPEARGAMDEVTEQRWMACVVGSSRYGAEHDQCHTLLELDFQPVPVRTKAFYLCQLTVGDNFSPFSPYSASGVTGSPLSKRRTIEWSWDWWKQTDMVNAAPWNHWGRTVDRKVTDTRWRDGPTDADKQFRPVKPMI